MKKTRCESHIYIFPISIKIGAGMAESGIAPEAFGETRDLVAFGLFGFKINP